MEVHWKIRFLRGFTKNQYVEGNYLKKGEAWIVCRFKGERLGEKEGGRIFPIPGHHLLARYNYCKDNPINLSNIGIQALKSHCKGARHLKLIETICNVKTITSLTTARQDITKPDSTAKVSEVPTYS